MNSVLVVLFALITPLLVMGMGLESLMVPAPRILLLLVKRIPDPNMQVVDAIFTVPVPVKVEGLFRITQLLPVSDIVPVLLIVPWMNRSNPLTSSIPAFVGAKCPGFARCWANLGITQLDLSQRSRIESTYVKSRLFQCWLCQALFGAS